MKNSKILIIGKNSYLAGGMEMLIPSADYASYSELDSNLDLIKNADVIINFAIQPEFSTTLLKKEDILDYKICQQIQDSNARFVFISSRKVYGGHTELKHYNESSPIQPNCVYSENKILAEKCLSELMGNKLTILRVSNIIGEPIFKANYKTFMGWISTSMDKYGHLSVNIKPDVTKDFITKTYFHEGIKSIIEKDISGVVNFGSGLNVPVVKILETMVGKENLILNPNTVNSEQFLLDCSVLQKIFKPMTKENLLTQCEMNYDIFNKMSKRKNKEIANAK